MDINNEGYKHKLSVVIITKNEEKNIKNCIESVYEATKGIDSEIILVDSASTDETIEKSKEYPIKILQLKKGWELTASAGRYIGFINSSGAYIQFIDGDMTLDKEWIKKALPYLEKQNEVAGVSGYITQDYSKSPVWKTMGKCLNKTKVDKPEKFKNFFGLALLKSNIIKKIGPYDPYIVVGEEGELCDRVIASGYKLLMLPFHSAHHHIEEEYKFFEHLHKRINFDIGKGQILRRSLRNKDIFLQCLWSMRFHFIIAFYLSVGIISFLVFFAYGFIHLIYLWLSILISISIWILNREKSIKNLTLFLIGYLLSWIFLIKGFLMPLRNPKEYPTDAIVIKA